MFKKFTNLKKLNVVCLVLFLFVFACQEAVAAEKIEPGDQQSPLSFIQFFKNIFKKIEFVSRVATIYDSNIFLSEDAENSDIITAFTQNLSLKLPEDPYYLQLDYTGNISYYLEEGDNIYNHNANFLFLAEILWVFIIPEILLKARNY